MRGLAGMTARRPWRVMLVTFAFLVAAVIGGGTLTGSLSPGGFEDPSAEFVEARDVLEAAGGESPAPAVIALVEPGSDVRTGEGRATVERVAATIAADPQVARVLTAFDGAGDALISRDGMATYMAVFFTPVSESDQPAVVERITDSLAGEEGVRLGGAAAVGFQVTDVISDDLKRAELIAFPIIFLLSLWVFRGVVAALLPSLMGVLVIMGGFLAVGLLNTVTEISVYALNLVIGLSLGLAIDYSLLIVSRFREELAGGREPAEAVARTLATAGRSVLFSAITVAAALAGLMVFPQPFLFSMGLGGVMVALNAALAALVVLPAVLMLLGRRVNALAPARWRARSEAAHLRDERGFWVVLSRAVMRRPALVAFVTAAGLVLVALPAFGVTFTTVDARALPASVEARAVSDTILDDFPENLSDPIFVAVEAPTDADSAAGVRALAAQIDDLPNADLVAPPVAVGDATWRIDVYTRAEPLSATGQDLVRDIRSAGAGQDVLVGGLAASLVDQKTSMGGRLPWAILVIALATMVALFLMTGSVILPLKAVIMNLLTLGVTMGLMVLIFQDGRLEGLLNFESVGALDITVPILLGAMAFGLATDYTVFLLSRIKEAHDAGEPTADAVAYGLQRTGRIVTAAALLFAVAIGAFVSSEVSLIKQLGLGTAAAVLIDATIIRALLVPSLMGMFGRWNWWAPAPLRRVYERVGWREVEPAAESGPPPA
ncbi:MAG: MMPL family transporter [Miltoncostaeaceae bacterium]